MEKIKGTTKSGFNYKINPERLDDMEFLELLTEADDNDPGALSLVVKTLLGKKQKAQLYDHLRTEDGRVPVTAVVSTVTEIFQQIKAKN